ncbi:MAG: hypothetical protein J6Z49_00640 [Kiritimatiellae bacterium]|nr:hypothetical protein [Kiritimatiellia bacterium]
MNMLKHTGTSFSSFVCVTLLSLFPFIARADAAVPMDGRCLSFLAILGLILFVFPAVGASFLLTACFAKRKKGWLIWGGVLLLLSGLLWSQFYA